jgi:hypothetical protein
MTKHLSPVELRQFTGSEHWYRHGLVRTVVFTDGAKYVADHAGAYWLLDTIALSQRFEKRVAAAAFQVWTLTVSQARSHGDPDVRPQQPQDGVSARAGIHGLPARGNPALLHRQHHPVAERVLARLWPQPVHAGGGFFCALVVRTSRAPRRRRP